MISFKDIIDGPEMFEQTFGPAWGRGLWRIFFIVVVLAIIATSGQQIWGFVRTVLSDTKEIPSEVKQAGSSQLNHSVREINAAQRATIKSQTIRGAKIVVIPMMPGEPERFANEIATAFQDAGADVKVRGGNMIQNGQIGVLVMFNHSDSIANSVFSSLKAANLNPSDLADTQGESVVYVKVGPKD